MKPTIHLGLIAYPGAQKSALHGLFDIFTYANSQAEMPLLEVQILEHATNSEQTFDCLILPPSLDSRRESQEQNNLGHWLVSQHQQGCILCSICAGALLLGDAGLLDERTATTHWALAEEFSAQFPRVRLDTDRLLIDEGDIITAGGLMAWTDLGLRLIEKYLGAQIMLQTARFFLIDPSGREQKHYSRFIPNFRHGDKAVLKAQHWLHSHSEQAITVPMMAETAHLEGRTFIRRFQAATGMNPSQYLQALRIDKAKALMELTKDTIEHIAWQVGYEDTSAFRRVFQKLTGQTPRDYKRKFCRPPS